jgi:Fe-S oxidoreductase
VILFVDTWTNYFQPSAGMAAVKLLETAGFDVLCPGTFCCGRPAISQGLLAEAASFAEFNLQRLDRFIESGIPVIGVEPSCTLTLVDEYPQLVRSAAARALASSTLTIDTFLARLLSEESNALTFRSDGEKVLMLGTGATMSLLRRAFGDRASEINSGCCGMAGAFGHEVEHYDVARAVGEQRLFPAVRGRGDAAIAVSGFSCREQISHHAGVAPRHAVEYLADRLVST